MTVPQSQGSAEHSERARISSPAATGNAGGFFEQHVGAYWLAQLMVRCPPPILIGTVVKEVHFQAERLGWNTDDIVIDCESPGMALQRLIVQVKRRFTVSAKNQECIKVVHDFWKDFKNSGRLTPDEDHLVLITSRGTDTLLGHFVGLLDCARAARNATEFGHRLGTKGLISRAAVQYCHELQDIVSSVEGQAVSALELWPFLRILHVLSLDLDSSTRQTEASVKSLLAHTAGEGDAAGVADTTWNTLLTLAGTAMSTGRSLRLNDLPQELRGRHTSIGGNSQRVLRALEEHARPILSGIRSTIGGELHLKRATLVQDVLETLESAQVVIVSGAAGVGKSAVAKNVVSALSRNHFVFAFRAEEFARPHIDTTLNCGQIPANIVTLGAIVATQDRKVILVDGVERLLERTTRDAFGDLLRWAASDCGMRLVLTCRDYSTDQVRASLLQPAGVKHAVVRVPLLGDTELAEVVATLPSLAYPLKNSSLRNILRNTYLLDKALEIPWSTERPIPESERDFRELFWREIVRAESRESAQMARRREEVLQQIAVRRAKALSMYVSGADLDLDAAERLRQDSLISSPEGNPTHLSTTHDVLEDWAILHWLEEQHLTQDESLSLVAGAIGTFPAIRRCCRKWISELTERDPGAGDKIFGAAITDTSLSAHFRDDVLVSVLKAASAPEFLLRHERELVAHERALLKRIIHLLRVACVTTPDWLAGAKGHGSILDVPSGQAWTTILKLVHGNIDSFTPQEHPLLLGLVEDAVRGISWHQPGLEGAEFVAGISHWLLDHFDDYHSDKPRERVLKTIAKIPTADAIRFEALLRGGAREDERLDRITDDFCELILSEIDGYAAGRDLPALVLSVATDHLCATEDQLQGQRYPQSSNEVEIHFGIRESLRHDYFPASAVRGPWIAILRHHPRQAIEFFAKLFGHVSDWYVNPRVYNPLEPAWRFELTFADGSNRRVWGNSRLWNLYRGTSVGPYVLQGMLMALERWLLEYADEDADKLDGVLVDILRRSDSAAVVAVVASVATAHPRECGEALLVLLSAPSCIVLDRDRMARETYVSPLSGMLPQLHADSKVYELERQQANKLPHRRADLETAIINLQLGPLAPRVHAMLDRHRAALPHPSAQSEDDRIWRLAMHRMDLRRYTKSTAPASELRETSSAEPKRGTLTYEPTEPEPDVKAMSDASAARTALTGAKMELLMWAHRVFRRENATPQELQMWRQRLSEAQLFDARNGHDPDSADVTLGGPGIVAAVCIRDNWDNMSGPQQDWCVRRACFEVLRSSNEWTGLAGMQRFEMAADRACAWSLAVLLGKPVSASQRSEIESAFAGALTHPNSEVRNHAVWGIAENAWELPDIAMRCVNALATEGTLLDRAQLAEVAKPWKVRRQMAELMAQTAALIRSALWRPNAIAPDAYGALDVSQLHGAVAHARILIILSAVPTNSAAIDGFVRAAESLVEWWDTDLSRRRSGGHRDRDFETETAISDLLQRFVMRSSPESARLILGPIFDAIDRHPDKVHSIVQGLTINEDRAPNTKQYWYLWGLFADGIQHASWLAHLDDEHPIGNEMMSVIFLARGWKEDVRHWKSLEGNASNVHALFEALPPSSLVLDEYLRFLYHIGEQSLPDAFIRLASSLRRGEPQRMLKESNSVYILEVLLQRQVYVRPLELKRREPLRNAVLFILDALVENGSSAAFRMRDDFVTPDTN